MHHADRRPRLGYLLAAVAAAMFALNGSLARFVLDDGVSAAHLSQLRVTLAFVLLAGTLAVVDRSRLRIARRDVPRMAWLGIMGLAVVQFTYFAAIDRLAISVALVIQFTGPLLVLLWLRIAHGRRLRPSLYGAVGALRARLGARRRGLRRRRARRPRRAVRGDRRGGLRRLPGRLRARRPLVRRVHHARRGASASRRSAWLVVSPPWTIPLGDVASVRSALLALGVVARRHAWRRSCSTSARSATCRPRRVGVVGDARAAAGDGHGLGDPRGGAGRRCRSPAGCSWSPPSPGRRCTRPRPEVEAVPGCSSRGREAA